MKDNQNDQTVQNNQKGQQNQTNPTSNQSGKIHEFENENLKKQSDLEIEQPNKEEKEKNTDIVSENFTNPQKNKISENKDITNEDIQLDVTNKNDYKSKINY